MGEHKLDRKKITDEVATQLAKIATDEGQLVELGWIAMLRHVIPKGADDLQVSEMRKAFFLGAEHVFTSVMMILDVGNEVTPTDLHRMDMLMRELAAFRKEVTSDHVAPTRTQ